MPESKGQHITEKSFEIIKNRLGSVSYSPAVMEIVTRIAHTTGDVAFAKTFYIPDDALQKGIEAIKKGHAVITDVEMVKTGIRQAWLEKFDCSIYCFLNDPWVINESAQTGQTRSHLGMKKAGELLNGAVIAIGNAPTALYSLLEIIKAGQANPALIVGVPVGFVGALESKQALYSSGYPAITNIGERGGSTIAAAIINGILKLAGIS